MVTTAREVLLNGMKEKTFEDFCSRFHDLGLDEIQMLEVLVSYAWNTKEDFKDYIECRVSELKKFNRDKLSDYINSIRYK